MASGSGIVDCGVLPLVESEDGGETCGSRAQVVVGSARSLILVEAVLAALARFDLSSPGRGPDDFLPGNGSEGIEGSISVTDPKKVLFSGGLIGGSAGAMQGDQA